MFIEGNWFATDFNGLTPPWDANMVYSFHKYWNENTQSAIQGYVNLRNNTNRPLWLGETGENSNRWFTDCVELLKNNNIGWAWWPHKKIKSIAGPLSAPLIATYQTLLNYWNGQGSQPSASFAMDALMTQADYLKFEACNFNKDVIDALIRQPFNSQTIPFANNQIPGTIYAVDFDMGKLNSAYNDLDNQNTGNGSWNSGFLYRNDGVDIESCIDAGSNGYDVGWIQSGEWLNYTVNILQQGIYGIKVNLASPGGGGYVVLLLDALMLDTVIIVPATGGWQNWELVTLNNIYLPESIHKLQVKFLIGNFNFSYLDFNLISTDVNNQLELPYEFSLGQNYPNPFNPKTTIFYSVGSASKVNIKIIDILGSEIVTLIDEYKQPGKYKVDFYSVNLSSGIYFYKMESGHFSSVKKLMLLK
jgi:hypothetical protein